MSRQARTVLTVGIALRTVGSVDEEACERAASATGVAEKKSACRTGGAGGGRRGAVRAVAVARGTERAVNPEACDCTEGASVIRVPETAGCA